MLRKAPWVPTVIVLTAVLWLTLAPHPLGEETIPMFPGADKMAHFLMFGGLTAVFLFDYGRTQGWRKITLPLAAAAGVFCGLFGIGLEYVQETMHIGRSKDFLDMVADMLGAVVTAMAWLCVKHVISNNNR